jgi:hypothetical protein
MGKKPGRTSSLEEASPANYICPSQDSDSLKSLKSHRHSLPIK